MKRGGLSSAFLSVCLLVSSARAQQTIDDSSITNFNSSLATIKPLKDSPNAKPGHTYWKDSKTGSIMDIWPCKEPDTKKPTLCMVGHTVKMSTEAARKEAAKNLEQTVDEMMKKRSWEKFCGFGPRIYNMYEKNGVKHGQLKVAFDWLRENGNGYKEGHTFEIEFREKEDKLTMTGWLSYVPFFKKHTQFVRVKTENVPPACVPPRIGNHGGHLPPDFIVRTP